MMALSCTSIEPRTSREAFKQVYRPAVPPAREQYDRQTLEVAFDGIPLWLAVQRIAKEMNVSVAVASNARNLPVAGTFRGATASEVIAGMAASVGVAASKTGRAYFLGQDLSGERASLVRPVMNVDADTIQEAVDILGDEVHATVSPQGVVIVAGSWTAVAEAEAMFQSLEAVDVSRWIVQLVFLEVSDKAASELAMEVTPSADVALRLATDAANTADATVALQAVLSASAEIEGVETIAEPLLLLIEGQAANLVIGERFPIRNRTVSDQGTVSDRDVSFLQTGLEITATVTTAATNAARLDLNFSRSSAVGESDGVPVVATQTFSTVADLEVGGVYLVGSLDTDEARENGSTFLRLGRGHSTRKSRVQVWCRVHRYNKPAMREYATSVGHGLLIPPTLRHEIVDEVVVSLEGPIANEETSPQLPQLPDAVPEKEPPAYLLQ